MQFVSDRKTSAFDNLPSMTAEAVVFSSNKIDRKQSYQSVQVPFKRSILVPGLIAWALLIAVAKTCFGGFSLRDCGYVETLLHPLSLEFIAGILLAALIRFKVIIPPAPTLIMATIWLTVSCVTRQIGTTDDFIFNGFRCIWFGVPCFLLLYGMLSFEITGSNVRYPSLLLILGNASYSIYLLHPLLLSMIRRWFTSLDTPMNCVAASIGCAVLFPALCIPFYYFIEKPLLNFCKKLLRFSDAG